MNPSKLKSFFIISIFLFFITKTFAQSGSLDLTFNPGAGFNNTVYTMCVQNDGKILVGGAFTAYNGVPVNHLVRLNSDGTIDSGFDTGTGFDTDVYAIAVQPNGEILVGGNFTTYNGVTRNSMVKLNANGQLDILFNSGTGFDGPVQMIRVLSNDKIAVGGDFTSFSGVTRIRLIVLLSDGSVDFFFDPLNGLDQSVIASDSLSDGKLIVGGDFTTYNLVHSRNKIACLESDGSGSLNLNFNPGTGFNGTVSTISVTTQDKIIVGGSFTEYNGVPVNRLVCLNSDGAIASEFSVGTGFNGNVTTTNILPNGKIIVAGSFSMVNGSTKNGIVCLNDNGSINPNFDIGTGFDNQVNKTVLQTNGNVLAAGQFSTYDGVSRNRIASLYNCFETELLMATACDSFELNGQTYLTSGTYTQDLLSVNGCDSTILLNLTINSVTTETVNVTACDSFNLNGIVYFNSGLYVQVLSNMNGCDSILVLNLTIYNSTSSNLFITACDSFLLNGTFYNSSGVYLQTLTNAVGCDSLLTLNLTIINSNISTLSVTTCDSYTLNGQTYTSSGTYTQSLTNVAGCDSLLTLILTINNSSSQTITTSACDTYLLNGQTYTSSGTYTQTLTNAAGCDSILTLNLTIIPSIPQQTNTFSQPSDPNSCLGQLAIQTTGNPNFTADIDGNTPFTYAGYHLESNLCPGVHTLTVTDDCGNTVPTTFVIPVDTNYVFNNPFIDSIAVDSLGQTIENCEIYYNSIDTAFIDSLWANGNTVNVIWNIVDSNGSNLDTNTYELNNGNGVYWLQLSVFCPVRALGDYFTVTEAIYFEDGSVTMAGLDDPELFEVHVFPNPTTGWINVQVDEPNGQLSVYDAQGKLFRSRIEMNGQVVVDLSQVESGVYFFQLETEQGSVVKRVVKQ